jgi:hypothetical protein
MAARSWRGIGRMVAGSGQGGGGIWGGPGVGKDPARSGIVAGSGGVAAGCWRDTRAIAAG